VSTARRGVSAVCLVALAGVIALAVLALSPALHRGSVRSAAANVPAASSSQAGVVSPAAQQRVRATYAALPLAFEPNQGQSDPEVKYLARGNGYKLYLTPASVILTMHTRGADSGVRRMMMDKRLGPSKVMSMLRKRQQSENKAASVAVLRMNLLGARPGTQFVAQSPQAGKVNYFIGRDPSKWHSNIPLFGEVLYRNLYPGVDLAFHGAGQHLEFDYLVSPGVETKSIALGFQGADKMTTNAAGDLILNTVAGPVEMHRPVAFQEKDGVRQNVQARFVLKNAKEVAFAVGPYDHSRQLVIDPTVTYSTYFGHSSGDFEDYGLGIAVDGSGNEFVAGATDSVSIPGFATPADNGSSDVFVTKISPAGALQFTTEFGGSGDDFPGGIAIDSTGIYVSGTTESPDFPVTAGTVQTTFEGGVADGNNDAFAAKLTLAGSLTGGWATYIAGSASDSGLAVAVDSSHNVYVVGETFSADLGSPVVGTSGVVNPLPYGGAINLGSGSGAGDGYIVKLNSSGTAYDLLSYIGGSGLDLATGVALDGSGNIYVSGETISTDLHVVNALQPQCGTDGQCNLVGDIYKDDAFIAAIKANLSDYTYLTYYGGNNVDFAMAITADSSGDAFITGLTQSSDFPLGSGTPYQKTLAGTQNAFVVELNPAGGAAAGGATYATFLGGSGTDLGLAIALDSSSPANIYITGQTSSSNFPTVNPTQAALAGSTDAFVSVLSPTQNTALFSTYLGGGGDEDQLGGSIALDASTENIYVTGDTDSGNGSTALFPTKSALDTTYGGGTCFSSTDTTVPTVPCPEAFIAAYTQATAPDFTISASAPNPASVTPGGTSSSTVTVTPLNGYSSAIALSCSVSGSGTPAPQCSVGTLASNMATMTITTTGTSSALFRRSNIFYAMWLPIVGMSLMGMGFSSARSRRKRLLGFFIITAVMAALFLLPACSSSSSSSGGGGGSSCTGCTPAGPYTVTVTGTGSDPNTTTHSAPPVTLTVN